MRWLETWRERRKHDGNEADGASTVGEATDDASKGAATGDAAGTSVVDENAHDDSVEAASQTTRTTAGVPRADANDGPIADATGSPRSSETGDENTAAAGTGDDGSVTGPEYGERAPAAGSTAGGGQAGDSEHDPVDAAGDEPVIIIVDKKPLFGFNMTWMLVMLVFALAMIWLGTGNASQPARDLQAMQEDVGKISAAVSKAASKRQAEVDKLLYDSPKPTAGQLDKLGGWKLELKQTAAKDKQHVTITNVAAPGGKGEKVWSGDLASKEQVKVRLHAPLETALDGSPTDKLVTRSYSITGSLKTDDGKKGSGKSGGSSATTGEAGDNGDNGYSIMSLINGDSDSRMADLKAVAVGSAGSGAGENGATRQQTAPGDEMDDALKPSDRRGARP